MTHLIQRLPTNRIVLAWVKDFHNARINSREYSVVLVRELVLLNDMKLNDLFSDLTLSGLKPIHNI